MNTLTAFYELHHEMILTILAFAGIAINATKPRTWDAGFWKTAWGWFYDASSEFTSSLSSKFSMQLQSLQGVNPPSPTPTQITEEKAGLTPAPATFPTTPK